MVFHFIAPAAGECSYYFGPLSTLAMSSIPQS